MSRPDDDILTVEDLHVEFATYGGTVQAVRGVSFDVPRGRTVGIVGESGCGKSVTMQAIMGLITMPPGRTQPRYAPCDKPTCLCPRALSATSTPYAYIELRNPNPEPVRAVLFADSGKADMPLVVAHYASPQVPDRDKREGCFGSVTFGAAPNTMTSSDEIQIPASKSVAVLIQSQFPNAPSGLTVTVKRLD